MNTHVKLLMVVLSAVGVVVCGCKTSQPGVTNSLGTLETLVEATPQAVTSATTEALKELDMVIISSKADKLCGQVIARTPEDTKVTVTMEPRPNNLTMVNVRSGAMGNAALSQRIIDKIKMKLYTQPPTPLVR